MNTKNDSSFTLYCFVHSPVGFQVKAGSKVDEAQFTGCSFGPSTSSVDSLLHPSSSAVLVPLAPLWVKAITETSSVSRATTRKYDEVELNVSSRARHQKNHRCTPRQSPIRSLVPATCIIVLRIKLINEMIPFVGQLQTTFNLCAGRTERFG